MVRNPIESHDSPPSMDSSMSQHGPVSHVGGQNTTHRPGVPVKAQWSSKAACIEARLAPAGDSAGAGR